MSSIPPEKRSIKLSNLPPPDAPGKSLIATFASVYAPPPFSLLSPSPPP